MSRSRAVPSYRHHKPTGQAVVTIRLTGGTRRDVYLGAYNSPESRTEYARIIAELATGPAATVAITTTVGGYGNSVPPTFSTSLTVSEALLAFWKHAEAYYRRPDGTATQEVSEYRQALRIVQELYGRTPTGQFGPLALKAVRAKMVEKNWSRKVVNARVNRVRRAFKWCASEQLVAAFVVEGLSTVAGLQAGRTASPETGPVEPVAWEHVAATLPLLRPHVGGMVRVQWFTGMRPGEACALRPCDIDTSGPVWLYRPVYWKMAYQGHKRVIAIGPRAQEVLNEFTPADPAGYYFSPAASVERFHAERADSRKTPLYASHARRNEAKRVANGARVPAELYTNSSYGYAIRRAVERLNEERKRAGAEPVPAWAPNQLRHALATEARKRYGLEAAQVLLGHARADVTQVYAEKNLALALKVAGEMG